MTNPCDECPMKEYYEDRQEVLNQYHYMTIYQGEDDDMLFKIEIMWRGDPPGMGSLKAIFLAALHNHKRQAWEMQGIQEGEQCPVIVSSGKHYPR